MDFADLILNVLYFTLVIILRNAVCIRHFQGFWGVINAVKVEAVFGSNFWCVQK